MKVAIGGDPVGGPTGPEGPVSPGAPESWTVQAPTAASAAITNELTSALAMTLEVPKVAEVNLN